MGLAPEQIVAGLVNSFHASLPLASLVPGGLWFGAVEQNVPEPYAMISITHQDTLVTANRYMISTDSIEVSIFSEAPITHESRTKIVSAMLDTWCGRLSWVTIDGGRMISMTPSGSELTLDPQRRDAQDILVAKQTFTIMTQGEF
jgi:hypothetical protein